MILTEVYSKPTNLVWLLLDGMLTMPGYSHHIHLTSSCPSDPLVHRTHASCRHRSKSTTSSHTQEAEGYRTMSYKVEELLALRDSVSESAVSIDRFADEDVIKGQS